MKLHNLLVDAGIRIQSEIEEIMSSERKDTQKKREIVNRYNSICNTAISKAKSSYDKAIIKAYRGFVTLTIAETISLDELESLAYIACKYMQNAKQGSHLEEV